MFANNPSIPFICLSIFGCRDNIHSFGNFVHSKSCEGNGENDLILLLFPNRKYILYQLIAGKDQTHWDYSLRYSS